ncbi:MULTISPECIES: hypothetical protein [Mycetohabitans]|uniref:hypothetical protein n=1 Tax=Mycetohabitans TaxID=2571159 RepID=UPI0012FF21B0|nr:MULTISPECIES: hypothetical protein [Mycetohabitans]MCF7697056.1 hypothetical protein [Mycetohabitans sp. B2]MCG1048752.1 hypothetical protein [Mycetohabitans sp. B6]
MMASVARSAVTECIGRASPPPGKTHELSTPLVCRSTNPSASTEWANGSGRDTVWLLAQVVHLAHDRLAAERDSLA